jgi:sigma-B regulation protein RsbU (phosphoserine phosphatase)
MAGSPLGVLPEPKDIVTLAHTAMARRLIGLESFVTSCYARFDVARRTVTLVDAGHTGVVLLRGGGSCEIVHGDNLPLGVREGEIYDQVAVRCEVGDVLLLFSDGVTEARSPHGELFGPDRLVACVRQHAGSEPAALVAVVRDAAQAFAGGHVLADDLTCVVVQVTPHPVPLARAELEIRSELDELRRARELVAGFCRARLSPPLDDAAVAALVLAVDEAACNAMKHAYHGRPDQRIQLVIEAFVDRVAVRLRYLGAPFDPSAVPPPSFDGSRESGFGVFMISKSVDDVRYYRDDLRRICIRLEKRRAA